MTTTNPNQGSAISQWFDARVVSMIRSLVKDPTLKWARLLTALGLAVGLAELLSLSFWAGCGVMLFQSVVVPAAVGYLALVRMVTPPQESKLSSAVVAGTLTGGTLATFQALIGPIQYFALGGERQLFAARGLPVPPITIGGVMAVVYSNIYVLIASAILSALAGLVGGILGRHSLGKQPHVGATLSQEDGADR